MRGRRQSFMGACLALLLPIGAWRSCCWRRGRAPSLRAGLLRLVPVLGLTPLGAGLALSSLATTFCLFPFRDVFGCSTLFPFLGFRHFLTVRRTFAFLLVPGVFSPVVHHSCGRRRSLIGLPWSGVGVRRALRRLVPLFWPPLFILRCGPSDRHRRRLGARGSAVQGKMGPRRQAEESARDEEGEKPGSGYPGPHPRSYVDPWR